MVVGKVHGHYVFSCQLIATLQNTTLVTLVSFYALLVVFCAGQLSCDRKTGNWHHKGWRMVSPSLDSSWYITIYMLGTTTKITTSFYTTVAN